MYPPEEEGDEGDEPPDVSGVLYPCWLLEDDGEDGV